MIALIRFILAILISPFKPKSRLEAENAALRQQLTVLQRKALNVDVHSIVRKRRLRAPIMRSGLGMLCIRRIFR